MYEIPLEPGERVILSVRKHWLIYVGFAILFGLLAYIPVFAVQFLSSYEFPIETTLFEFSLDHPAVRFVIGAWWLFVWMGFFSAFSRNFLDVWVVTSKRVIVIEQHGFWRREVMTLLIDHALDVRTHIHGFFPTLFGFGTIDVDSAGPVARHFSMPWIYRPMQVRETITKLISSRYKEPDRPFLDGIV